MFTWKNKQKDLRRQDYFSYINDVMIKCEYAEALKPQFDMESMSEEFGFNRTIYLKGSTYEYHDKYCNDVINQTNVNMEFHSHFSYDSAQNEATLCNI